MILATLARSPWRWGISPCRGLWSHWSPDYAAVSTVRSLPLCDQESCGKALWLYDYLFLCTLWVSLVFNICAVLGLECEMCLPMAVDVVLIVVLIHAPVLATHSRNLPHHQLFFIQLVLSQCFLSVWHKMPWWHLGFLPVCLKINHFPKTMVFLVEMVFGNSTVARWQVCPLL